MKVIACGGLLSVLHHHDMGSATGGAPGRVIELNAQMADKSACRPVITGSWLRTTS
jgi:hypothetical protein